MKLTLELDSREDAYELENIMNAPKMRAILDSYMEALRQKLKYEDMDDKTYEAFDKARDMLIACMEEENYYTEQY